MERKREREEGATLNTNSMYERKRVLYVYSELHNDTIKENRNSETI